MTTKRDAALLGAAISILLSACSILEQKNYTVPEAICGTEITPGKMLPLLPEGDQFAALSDIDSTQEQRHELCSVRIDSSEKLHTEIYFFTGRLGDPAQILSDADLTAKEIHVHGDAAVSDTRFIAYLECNPPGVPPENGHIYLDVSTGNDVVEDDGERMELLEEFSRDYADALWEKHECGA